LSPRCAAGASQPHVAQVARDWLSRGNAVDAVVAGVLLAAAESPTVVLGPLQVLVSGSGAGLLAIDGRVRQPGLGVPRPRGLLVDDPVPLQARVGVPALPASLALVLASLGSLSQLRLAGGAIERARVHSAERAQFLEALARRGVSALSEDAVARELTAVAGRAAGGLLTRKDLVSVRPAIVACDARSLGPSGVLMVPWKDGVLHDASSTHVVAAIDARGLVAIACYEEPLDGLAVPALGLAAPAFATPVMRGETRVRPGEPRPAAAPIALRAPRGIADLAVGLGQTPDAETSLEVIVRALGDERANDFVLESPPNGRVVAIARGRAGGRIIASA
jgi:hypothetical protein